MRRATLPSSGQRRLRWPRPRLDIELALKRELPGSSPAASSFSPCRDALCRWRSDTNNASRVIRTTRCARDLSNERGGRIRIFETEPSCAQFPSQLLSNFQLATPTAERGLAAPARHHLSHSMPIRHSTSDWRASPFFRPSSALILSDAVTYSRILG